MERKRAGSRDRWGSKNIYEEQPNKKEQVHKTNKVIILISNHDYLVVYSQKYFTKTKTFNLEGTSPIYIHWQIIETGFILFILRKKVKLLQF